MSTDKAELVLLQRTLYESSNATRRWLHCSRRDWIMDAIGRATPPARKQALEIGPGSGVYLPTLARFFNEVTAIDVEDEYLHHLSPLLVQHPNIRVAKDDITASQLPADTFDLILCSEVLEHIPNSQTALSEIYRLLKPSGVLIASTPQRYSPLELAGKIAFLPGVVEVVRLIYREPVIETGHVNLMTEREVRRQISDAGFSVEESFKSGIYLPLVAEFGGAPAQKLEAWLEHRIRNGVFDWLLWTQYYVARKPGGLGPSKPRMA